VITIRHLLTGEHQFVAALDGIDPDVWEATAEVVPTDLASRAYTTVDGALKPKPPVMSRFDYLRLWTPAEALAVQDSSNADLRWAFLLLNGLETVDLAVPEVQQGIAAALALNILTEARAARIAAGLPPL